MKVLLFLLKHGLKVILFNKLVLIHNHQFVKKPYLNITNFKKSNTLD